MRGHLLDVLFLLPLVVLLDRPQRVERLAEGLCLLRGLLEEQRVGGPQLAVLALRREELRLGLGVVLL
jgi:hypothetical protein